MSNESACCKSKSFCQVGPAFLVVDVADAFEDQDRKDVGLEGGGADRNAQDVGGFPEAGFELRGWYGGHGLGGWARFK